MNREQRRQKRVQVMRAQRKAARLRNAIAALQSFGRGTVEVTSPFINTRTIVVDPNNGDDFSGNGTTQKPFKTMKAVLSVGSPVRTSSWGADQRVVVVRPHPWKPYQPQPGGEWIMVPPENVE